MSTCYRWLATFTVLLASLPVVAEPPAPVKYDELRVKSFRLQRIGAVEMHDVFQLLMSREPADLEVPATAEKTDRVK